MKIMLTRDSRWEIFYGDISLEDFTNTKMPKATFKKEVSDDVKNAFDVVHKLLTHAYYEYLFLDIAITRALHIFEMALIIRYSELNNGTEWDLKAKPLAQLIKWFNDRHYFEINSQLFLDHVRNARNSLSHLKHHSFGGIAGMHWIPTINDLINGLYDDIQLRQDRWTSTKELDSKLRNFLANGAQLTHLNKKYLIYGSGYCSVDNTSDENLFYFSLLPIFDTTSPYSISPFVFSYFKRLINFDNPIIDLSFDSGNIQLSNQITPEEQNLVAEFKLNVQSSKPHLVKNIGLLFDSENWIRQEIRKRTLTK